MLIMYRLVQIETYVVVDIFMVVEIKGSVVGVVFMLAELKGKYRGHQDSNASRTTHTLLH
jgi:hypothetical protein